MKLSEYKEPAHGDILIEQKFAWYPIWTYRKFIPDKELVWWETVQITHEYHHNVFGNQWILKSIERMKKKEN